jgi:hypothetical protein
MWLVRDGRFWWRKGYWLGYRAGWVYNPPAWVWTPRGYLLVGAYWDYPLEARGIIFAPYYVRRGLWARPFTPTVVVGIGPLTASLWLRPGLGYAYGDYYGPVYARRGYQAWAVYGTKARDPLFGYYRAANITNPAWERNLISTYRGRVAGDIARPPRTYAAQVRSGTASAAVVTPLASYRPAGVRLTTVTRTEVIDRTRTATALRRAAVDRRTVETTRSTTTTTRPTFKIHDVPTPRPHRTDAPRYERPGRSDPPRVTTPPPPPRFTPPPPPPHRPPAVKPPTKGEKARPATFSHRDHR